MDNSIKPNTRQKRRGYNPLILCVSYSAVVVGLFATTGAFAQTKIEQMIVTAQKRAQDIQAVPASISAFSGEGLQERQINNVEGVLNATPNVYFASGPGNTPSVVIRGIGPEGINASVDPSIGFHVDGVYQPRVYGVQGLMNDLDSVEVLRGPQGTLYGRNANAGVINFNTKRATDTFEASATVFGGSYKRYGARGYVSGPIISDKVALRVSGIVDRHSGWGHNTFTGARPEADYFSAGRISLRLKPIDDVTIDLIAGMSKDHNTKDRYTFVGREGANAAPNYAFIVANSSARFDTRPFHNSSNHPPEQTHVQKTATAIINWDVSPNISLRSITGFQHGVDDTEVDVDTLSYPFVWTHIAARSSTFSQEFNLNAKLFDRLETVVGLYYLRDHNNAGTLVPFERGFPSPSLLPTAPRDKYLVSYVDFIAKSKAIFMDNTFSVTDDLRLLAGIRRTLDEKDNYQTQYTAGPITGSSVTACVPRARVKDLDYHSTTGKLGVQYDFTPDIMGYVQWQNGFKTGGINSSLCNQSFNPEKVRSWEAGVKSTLFDSTMTLNISAFSYNYQDLQLSRTIGTSQIVDNAARAKIKGFELESVANLSDDLRVDVALGYLHSKYSGFSSVHPQTGLVVNTDGNQLTKAPKLTLNVGLEYTMRLGDLGELRSRGEAAYRSRVYFTPFNELIAKQDAYWVGNLLFTFTPDDCPYSFQAYVKNVTDKPYRVGDSSSGLVGYSYGQWGDPRTFGVEATVKF